MTDRWSPARIAAAVLLSASLAGCGVLDDSSQGTVGALVEPSFTSLTPDEMLELGVAATRSVGSLHVSGTFVDDSEKVYVDLSIQDRACVGDVEFRAAHLDLIHSPEGTFVRANEAYWREALGEEAEQTMRRLDGRWAVVPPDVVGFTGLCELDTLLDEVLPDLDNADPHEGRLLESGGVPAQELVVGGEIPRVDSVWVAVEGDHYIVKVVQAHQFGAPNLIIFSEFDVPVDASPPPADEYVDLLAEDA